MMLHRSALVRGAVGGLVLSMMAAACAVNPAPPAEAPRLPHDSSRAPLRPERGATPVASGGEWPEPERAPEGFGTVEPWGDAVGPIAISTHSVKITLLDGIARSEITEEIANHGVRQAEVHYRCRLPAGASLSRLALWVGDRPVEGEMVERYRARDIYEEITGASRDPALLEREGQELSLRVFPVPAHGTRRVLVAYDQRLHAESGRIGLALPLASPGVARERVSIEVTARHAGGPLEGLQVRPPSAEIRTEAGFTRVRYEGSAAASLADTLSSLDDRQFSLSYRLPARESAALVVHRPHAPSPGIGAIQRSAGAVSGSYFALRLRAPELAWQPSEGDLAVVIDTSASAARAFEQAVDAIHRMVDALPTGRRFTLLACDTACAGFPSRGLAVVSGETVRAARGWLRRRAVREAASDVEGAIRAGIRRLEPGRGGDLIYVGDGVATAGELSASAIVDALVPELTARAAHLLVAATGSAPPPWLDALRSGTSVTSLALTAVPDGGTGLAAVLSDVRVELPSGFELVSAPTELTSGREVVLTGKLRAPAATSAAERQQVVLAARRGDEPVRIALPLERSPDSNPLVPRLWAEDALARAEDDPGIPYEKVVAFSKHHHVLSKYTSLLVLESEAEFARYRIPRTQGTAGSLGSADWSVPELEPQPRAARGVFLPRHRMRAPTVRMSFCKVSGRTPPEVIQRIVRLNHGRFRACYLDALRREPRLEGRISVRFQVNGRGQVRDAAVEPDTNVIDPELRACVVSAFEQLAFPPPEGGDITVVYPLALARGGSTQPGPSRGPRLRKRLEESRSASSEPEPTRLPRVRVRPASIREGDCVLVNPAAAAWTDAEARQALIRGCFARAQAMAERARRDNPDSRDVHALAADIASVRGGAAAYAGVWAGWIERHADDGAAHDAAARAYSAAGDPTRSCAHWRAAARLGLGTDRVRYEAVRCLAALGERDLARAEAQLRAPRSSGPAAALEGALLAGGVPRPLAAPAPEPGALRVGVTWAEGDPRAALQLVTPTGSVISPWSYAANRIDLAAAAPIEGIYQVVAHAAPGARARVTARVAQSRSASLLVRAPRSPVLAVVEVD